MHPNRKHQSTLQIYTAKQPILLPKKPVTSTPSKRNATTSSELTKTISTLASTPLPRTSSLTSKDTASTAAPPHSTTFSATVTKETLRRSRNIAATPPAHALSRSQVLLTGMHTPSPISSHTSSHTRTRSQTHPHTPSQPHAQTPSQTYGQTHAQPLSQTHVQTPSETRSRTHIQVSSHTPSHTNSCTSSHIQTHTRPQSALSRTFTASTPSTESSADTQSKKKLKKPLLHTLTISNNWSNTSGKDAQESRNHDLHPKNSGGMGIPRKIPFSDSVLSGSPMALTPRTQIVTRTRTLTENVLQNNPLRSHATHTTHNTEAEDMRHTEHIPNTTRAPDSTTHGVMASAMATNGASTHCGMAHGKSPLNTALSGGKGGEHGRGNGNEGDGNECNGRERGEGKERREREGIEGREGGGEGEGDGGGRKHGWNAQEGYAEKRGEKEKDTKERGEVSYRMGKMESRNLGNPGGTASGIVKENTLYSGKTFTRKPGEKSSGKLRRFPLSSSRDNVKTAGTTIVTMALTAQPKVMRGGGGRRRAHSDVNGTGICGNGFDTGGNDVCDRAPCNRGVDSKAASTSDRGAFGCDVDDKGHDGGGRVAGGLGRYASGRSARASSGSGSGGSGSGGSGSGGSGGNGGCCDSGSDGMEARISGVDGGDIGRGVVGGGDERGDAEGHGGDEATAGEVEEVKRGVTGERGGRGERGGGVRGIDQEEEMEGERGERRKEREENARGADMHGEGKRGEGEDDEEEGGAEEGCYSPHYLRRALHDSLCSHKHTETTSLCTEAFQNPGSHGIRETHESSSGIHQKNPSRKSHPHPYTRLPDLHSLFATPRNMPTSASGTNLPDSGSTQGFPNPEFRNPASFSTHRGNTTILSPRYPNNPSGTSSTSEFLIFRNSGNFPSPRVDSHHETHTTHPLSNRDSPPTPLPLTHTHTYSSIHRSQAHTQHAMLSSAPIGRAAMLSPTPLGEAWRSQEGESPLMPLSPAAPSEHEEMKLTVPASDREEMKLVAAPKGEEVVTSVALNGYRESASPASASVVACLHSDSISRDAAATNNDVDGRRSPIGDADGDADGADGGEGVDESCNHSAVSSRAALSPSTRQPSIPLSSHRTTSCASLPVPYNGTPSHHPKSSHYHPDHGSQHLHSPDEKTNTLPRPSTPSPSSPAHPTRYNDSLPLPYADSLTLGPLAASINTSSLACPEQASSSLAHSTSLSSSLSHSPPPPSSLSHTTQLLPSTSDLSRSARSASHRALARPRPLWAPSSLLAMSTASTDACRDGSEAISPTTCSKTSSSNSTDAYAGVIRNHAITTTTTIGARSTDAARVHGATRPQNHQDVAHPYHSQGNSSLCGTETTMKKRRWKRWFSRFISSLVAQRRRVDLQSQLPPHETAFPAPPPHPCTTHTPTTHTSLTANSPNFTSSRWPEIRRKGLKCVFKRVLLVSVCMQWWREWEIVYSQNGKMEEYIPDSRDEEKTSDIGFPETNFSGKHTISPNRTLFSYRYPRNSTEAHPSKIPTPLSQNFSLQNTLSLPDSLSFPHYLPYSLSHTHAITSSSLPLHHPSSTGTGLPYLYSPQSRSNTCLNDRGEGSMACLGRERMERERMGEEQRREEREESKRKEEEENEACQYGTGTGTGTGKGTGAPPITATEVTPRNHHRSESDSHDNGSSAGEALPYNSNESPRGKKGEGEVETRAEGKAEDKAEDEAEGKRPLQHFTPHNPNEKPLPVVDFWGTNASTGMLTDAADDNDNHFTIFRTMSITFPSMASTASISGVLYNDNGMMDDNCKPCDDNFNNSDNNCNEYDDNSDNKRNSQVSNADSRYQYRYNITENTTKNDISETASHYRYNYRENDNNSTILASASLAITGTSIPRSSSPAWHWHKQPSLPIVDTRDLHDNYDDRHDDNHDDCSPLSQPPSSITEATPITPMTHPPSASPTPCAPAVLHSTAPAPAPTPAPTPSTAVASDFVAANTSTNTNPNTNIATNNTDSSINTNSNTSNMDSTTNTNIPSKAHTHSNSDEVITHTNDMTSTINIRSVNGKKTARNNNYGKIRKPHPPAYSSPTTTIGHGIDDTITETPDGTDRDDESGKAEDGYNNHDYAVVSDYNSDCDGDGDIKGCTADDDNDNNDENDYEEEEDVSAGDGDDAEDDVESKKNEENRGDVNDKKGREGKGSGYRGDESSSMHRRAAAIHRSVDEGQISGDAMCAEEEKCETLCMEGKEPWSEEQQLWQNDKNKWDKERQAWCNAKKQWEREKQHLDIERREWSIDRQQWECAKREWERERKQWMDELSDLRVKMNEMERFQREWMEERRKRDTNTGMGTGTGTSTGMINDISSETATAANNVGIDLAILGEGKIASEIISTTQRALSQSNAAMVQSQEALAMARAIQEEVTVVWQILSGGGGIGGENGSGGALGGGRRDVDRIRGECVRNDVYNDRLGDVYGKYEKKENK